MAVEMETESVSVKTFPTWSETIYAFGILWRLYVWRLYVWRLIILCSSLYWTIHTMYYTSYYLSALQLVTTYGTGGYDRVLSQKQAHLINNNFITRMLYKDCYWLLTLQSWLQWTMNDMMITVTVIHVLLPVQYISYVVVLACVLSCICQLQIIIIIIIISIRTKSTNTEKQLTQQYRL